ncbi:MAG TPA: MarR family transcriptional regulator, partial [Beijerinckiaceae bacterium]|nr:MarR family transcriptional regulator [Beijerinckiaceae bacterium]
KLLRRAHRSYSRRLQDELAAHGVSLAQYLHLRELWELNGITQNELSQKVGIEKASSTAVLDALEKNGLIVRVRNAQDRRKVNVHLTPAGQKIRDKLSPAARGVALRAVSDLSEAELDSLFSALNRVIASLDPEG